MLPKSTLKRLTGSTAHARKVPDAPEQGPARKTRALAAGSMRYRCAGIPPAKSGQAEVGQHGPAVQGQQDIVRLDFEVKDDGDVCGPQRA